MQPLQKFWACLKLSNVDQEEKTKRKELNEIHT